MYLLCGTLGQALNAYLGVYASDPHSRACNLLTYSLYEGSDPQTIRIRLVLSSVALCLKSSPLLWFPSLSCFPH